MPELAADDPHRANATRRWNPAVRQKDYVYQGQGYDIFEDVDDDPWALEHGWVRPVMGEAVRP